VTATSGTIAERILETLRTSARPWDDDELAQRLGVTQRQTINQICRRLAADGQLQRYIGDVSKLVNALTAPQAHAHVVGAPAPTER
jgi:DNA-binding Lrp family transcriptional regulator